MVKEFTKLLDLDAVDAAKDDRQFVTALARGLEVLRVFQPTDGPLGNQEIAERTGLPKPTVSRITHTLTTLGYLDYIPRMSRYAIAPSVLSLGHRCITAAGIKHVAKPYLEELADRTQATVALGARDRLNMVYIDVARGNRAVAFSLDPGAQVPIYNTAMGAAYLYALPEKEREFLFEAIARHAGDGWNTVLARMQNAFQEIDELGFCIFEGTYEKAINGIGCPLVQPDGSVMAVSCSAPVYEFSRRRIEGDIGPRLAASCSAIRGDMARMN